MKMRVWWIPQLPMKAFTVDIENIQEGVKVINILADYDKFQYENKIKPDYCNTGGIEVFDTTDKTASSEGSWVDWWDEETGEDDPHTFIENMENKEM